MRTRCWLTLLTLGTMALVVPLPSAGQTRTDGDAPRTGWGDPDLQGTWSYASLTPLQRPADLADREFYTPEEAAARDVSVTRDVPPRPGDVGAYNALWFDRGRVSPDRRTSLIVNPADGRLPVRPETEQRAAAQREHRRRHPADSWLDRSNWDRCITYHGVPPVSTGYNNTYQIFQAPGYVAILVENIHDVRIIPLDGRPQLDRRHPPVERELAWSLGGRHAGRRDGQLQRPDAASVSVIAEHARGRAVHTRRRERDRASVHDRRPDGLHAALDRRADDAPARRLHRLRVRLP